jgi:hypothetical protein
MIPMSAIIPKYGPKFEPYNKAINDSAHALVDLLKEFIAEKGECKFKGDKGNKYQVYAAIVFICMLNRVPCQGGLYSLWIKVGRGKYIVYAEADTKQVTIYTEKTWKKFEEA